MEVYYGENIWTFSWWLLRSHEKIKDKSIDLILCDPPFGVTRCDWDKVIANTNRRFKGIEITEKYFNISKNRVERAYNKKVDL